MNVILLISMYLIALSLSSYLTLLHPSQSIATLEADATISLAVAAVSWYTLSSRECDITSLLGNLNDGRRVEKNFVQSLFSTILNGHPLA